MHQEIIDAYYEWHISKFGFKPMIDGGDGKGVKTIITFLNSQDAQVDTVTLFKMILERWDELSDFYQKQTRLRQISSNLHNIIHILKDGKSTKNKYGVSEEYIRGLIDDMQG